MPDTIYITLFSQAALQDSGRLGDVLDVFEAKGFQPTHWGPDERARNEYDRNEMISAVGGFSDELHVPGLHRRKPPRYQAHFDAKTSGLASFKVELGSAVAEKDLPRVFDLGEGLASSLKPEFGFVHLIWKLGEKSQDYSASGILSLDEFVKCGPSAVCARTWLGPHLAGLIGRERLAESTAPVTDEKWGGVRLDLVEEPWRADFEVLSRRQEEVMSHLRPSGVFGDYSDSFDCKPGPSWRPPSS